MTLEKTLILLEREIRERQIIQKNFQFQANAYAIEQIGEQIKKCNSDLSSLSEASDLQGENSRKELVDILQKRASLLEQRELICSYIQKMSK